jgi:hypothetical protein
MHPKQVIDVLMGGVPLLADPESAAVSWEGRDGGREVLTLKDPRGNSEVIYLQAEQQTWDVREAEGKDEKGTTVWRLRHEGFSPVPLETSQNDAATSAPAPSAAVRLPSVTYIEDPPHKSDLRLRWRERELNPQFEEGAFHLDAPPGVPIEPDLCEAPPAAVQPSAADKAPAP